MICVEAEGTNALECTCMRASYALRLTRIQSGERDMAGCCTVIRQDSLPHQPGRGGM